MIQTRALEQYLLEFINAERSAAHVQPLAFNDSLNTASEKHSQWMIGSDLFSHTGVGGSTITDRITAAGYTLDGAWADGENIAWLSTRDPAGYRDEVDLLHANLMASAGHRENILSSNYREAGIGFELGEF